MVKKKKKKKEVKDNTHYCTKCKKRTEHRGEGIKWIRYIEYCIKCKTINYSEYQKNGK
jgi:hypothetical protein